MEIQKRCARNAMKPVKLVARKKSLVIRIYVNIAVRSTQSRLEEQRSAQPNAIKDFSRYLLEKKVILIHAVSARFHVTNAKASNQTAPNATLLVTFLLSMKRIAWPNVHQDSQILPEFASRVSHLVLLVKRQLRNVYLVNGTTMLQSLSTIMNVYHLVLLVQLRMNQQTLQIKSVTNANMAVICVTLEIQTYVSFVGCQTQIHQNNSITSMEFALNNVIREVISLFSSMETNGVTSVWLNVQSIKKKQMASAEIQNRLSLIYGSLGGRSLGFLIQQCQYMHFQPWL